MHALCMITDEKIVLHAMRVFLFVSPQYSLIIRIRVNFVYFRLLYYACENGGYSGI